MKIKRYTIKATIFLWIFPLTSYRQVKWFSWKKSLFCWLLLAWWFQKEQLAAVCGIYAMKIFLTFHRNYVFELSGRFFLYLPNYNTDTGPINTCSMSVSRLWWIWLNRIMTLSWYVPWTRDYTVSSVSGIRATPRAHVTLRTILKTPPTCFRGVSPSMSHVVENMRKKIFSQFFDFFLCLVGWTSLFRHFWQSTYA